MSLATKYRPATFEDVCGQNITTTLLNKVIEQGKLSNAILLAGASGCGKTTCARIIANKINKGIGTPIEFDAPSLDIDDVRSLRDSANQRAVAGEYKVFIIDECHRLGGDKKDCWNALLKVLEECPKYTIFILCTTEPNKVIPAIMNRVQRYNFTPIAASEIKTRLEYICKQEGFTNYTDTCELISKTCNGGMRDAIATLESCAAFSTDLCLDNSKQVLGETSYEAMFKLTWALQQNNEKEILNIIDNLYNQGRDLKQFMSNFLDFTLDIQRYILFNDITDTSIPGYLASEKNPVVQFTVKPENSLEYFRALTEKILAIKQIIRYDSNCKSTIIVELLNFTCGK